MPVDLSIPNLILQSYIAGRRERLTREQQAEEVRQFNEQLKLREQALKEEQKRFEQTESRREQEFKSTFNLNKALRDIQGLQARQEIAKETALTGITPPGARQIFSAGFGTPESTQKVLELPTGDQITIPSAEELARHQEVLQRPKISADISRIQARSAADLTVRSIVEDLKAKNAASLKEVEIKSREDIASAKRSLDWQIAQLRVRTTLSRVGVNTRKLSAKQVEELASLNILERQFQQFRDLISSPETSQFFQGPISGGISNLAFKVTQEEPKPFLDIRAKQASVVSYIGHKLYGSALTATEVTRLAAEFGSLGRGMTLKNALSKINNAIELIQLRKQERLALYETAGAAKEIPNQLKGKWITNPDGSREFIEEK